MLSHYEETNRFLVGRRGNLIHSLRHPKERIMRRKNLILSNPTVQRFPIPQYAKMRSSRPQKARAQDDA